VSAYRWVNPLDAMTREQLEDCLAQRRAVLDRVYRRWLRGDEFTSRLEAERKCVADLERRIAEMAR